MSGSVGLAAAVNSPPEILGLGCAIPYPAVAGVALSCSAGVIDDQPNRLMSYTFHFGDGFTRSGSAKSGDIFTSHSYAVTGTYRLVFEVTDAQGATAAQSTDVFVSETDILHAFTSIDIHPDRGVPARIWVSDRITGSYRNTWGLDWMKTLLVGVYPTYTVAFSDVPGYGTPPLMRGNCPGPFGSRVFDCNGVYTANGWLRVITNPPVPGTIYVDGVPRDDWGTWADLPPGTYTVSFGPVAGYVPPPSQTVMVRAEELITIIGDYVLNPASPGPDPSTFGMLRVVTQLDTGQRGVPTLISIDGVPRDRWGLNWLKLPPGCYSISFGDIPGLGTPEAMPACVSAGQVREVTAVFQLLGWIRVTLSPALPATISVDWAPYNDWGVWTAVKPGDHTIAFGHADGYVEPDFQTITIIPGGTTSVVGVYVPVG